MAPAQEHVVRGIRYAEVAAWKLAAIVAPGAATASGSCPDACPACSEAMVSERVSSGTFKKRALEDAHGSTRLFIRGHATALRLVANPASGAARRDSNAASNAPRPAIGDA